MDLKGRMMGWQNRSLSAGSTHTLSGFTLTELLVVLALVGLFSLAGPPMIAAGLPGVKAKSVAQSLANHLRSARSTAILENETILIKFDPQLGQYQISKQEEAIELPDQTRLDFQSAKGAPPVIKFYSDGSSSGGEITIALHERHYQISVKPLFGRIKIEKAR